MLPTAELQNHGAQVETHCSAVTGHDRAPLTPGKLTGVFQEPSDMSFTSYRIGHDLTSHVTS